MSLVFEEFYTLICVSENSYNGATKAHFADSSTAAACYVSGDRKNSDLFLDLVRHLRSTYRKAKKVHISLDNYVIHKSKRTLTEMKNYA